MSDTGWPDGPMVRWARVVDGVVVESPMEYPLDPNLYYEGVDPPQTFFECPDSQVDCHWLYDQGTNTYSEPLPVEPEFPTVAVSKSVLTELKNNPELLEELRQLLVK